MEPTTWQRGDVARSRLGGENKTVLTVFITSYYRARTLTKNDEDAHIITESDWKIITLYVIYIIIHLCIRVSTRKGQRSYACKTSFAAILDRNSTVNWTK
jgi:hypothetical protein